MIDDDVQFIGHSHVVRPPGLHNLYGCTIGERVVIGPFVEVQRGAVIGDDSHICSHAFICGGAQIGQRVFIGHGVMTCNDPYPVIGEPTKLATLTIGNDVSIGSGAVLLPVSIGNGAIIGAGSVVTRDVPPWTVYAGNPARFIRHTYNKQQRAEWLFWRREVGI